MAAAWLSVCSVVGTHDGFHISLCDQSLKSRQICLPHILHGHLSVELVTDRFRAAVHSIVFGAGRCFHHFPVTLYALHEFHTESGGQIRVLTVSLMASSPAGVTENIHIGRPESQSFVNIPVSMFGILIVLCAAFCGYDIAHLFHFLIVESRSHTDSLGEHGSHTGPCHAVQGFIPVIISRHIQAFYRRCIVF